MKKSFLIILLLAYQFAQSQTIADLLSPAFPTSIVADHQGASVAWVFNDKGSRNIFYGNPANNNITQLTNYKGDDGVDIANLCFAINDAKIYFVRGNTLNNKGEAANPAQLQFTTEQNIYSVDINTRQVKKLVKGNNPLISPDGKLLLYTLSGKVWKINTNEESPVPQQLFFSRGSSSGLQFNKTGTQLLFVSSREEHNFIGVYDFATNSVRFPEPGTYVDSDPVWNEAGTHIAFVRRPFVRNNFPFTPKRDQAPWEIRMVDVNTGKGITVFKADQGVGSVFVDDLPAVATKISWTKDDHIIFPWEKTGWMHLYSVQVATKKVLELTPGNGEVETVQLSPDGNNIYYVTNIGDSNRRHIWKTTATSKAPVLVTPGKGIDYSPVVLNSGLAYFSASAIKPAWPMFISTEGKVQAIASNLFPANFPSNLVTPQTIMVKALDNQLAPAQLFLPNNYDANKKYPAIIFLHGGSRRQMLEGFNYGYYYSNAYALNEYFAQQGYIVMALNYRSGIGYGFNFREAKNYGMSGGAEVNDLIGAGEYLKARKDVDASKIGLWGGSYGGYLTAHGLTRRSDLFSVGVDIHGVHNWNDEEPTFAPWYDSLRYTAFAQTAYKSSPVYNATTWKSPVLFMHGDDDRNVPFTETIHMIHQLRKQGVEVEEKIFPDEIHAFLLYNSWLTVDEKTFEFIHRHFNKK